MGNIDKIPRSFEKIESAFEAYHKEYPEDLAAYIRDMGEDPKEVSDQIDFKFRARIKEHAEREAAKKRALHDRVASKVRGIFDSLGIEEMRARLREMFAPKGSPQTAFKDFDHLDKTTMRTMLEDAEILKEMNRISGEQTGND
jgi:hypothetical protein